MPLSRYSATRLPAIGMPNRYVIISTTIVSCM